MEVNNNNEINKMFGEEPVKPAGSGAGDQPLDPKSAEQAELAAMEAQLEAEASPFQGGDPYNDGADGETPKKGADGTIEGSATSFGFATEKDIKKAHRAHKTKRVPLSLMLAVSLILLILGCAGGIFLSANYVFGSSFTKSEYQAAITATDAITDVVNKTFGGEKNIAFFEVFSKEKVHEFECVVFCAIETETAVFDDTHFRVVIDKEYNEVNVYAEFNPAEYNSLASGSDEERVQAGFLINQKNEFERCLSEIRGQDDDPETETEGVDRGWVKVKTAYPFLRVSFEK